MKKIALVFLVVSVASFSAIAQQSSPPQTSPFPSAKTAKEKRDDLDRLKREKEELEKASEEMERKYNEAKSKVADITAKVSKAQQDYKIATEAFQKELVDARAMIDASLKLLEIESASPTSVPVVKPQPKKGEEKSQAPKVEDKIEGKMTPLLDEPTTGKLLVNVHLFDKLAINGKSTSESGTTRTFRARDLIQGKEYVYTLQVTTSDGTVVTKKVLLKAGMTTTVSFVP